MVCKTCDFETAKSFSVCPNCGASVGGILAPNDTEKVKSDNSAKGTPRSEHNQVNSEVYLKENIKGLNEIIKGLNVIIEEQRDMRKYLKSISTNTSILALIVLIQIVIILFLLF